MVVDHHSLDDYSDDFILADDGTLLLDIRSKHPKPKVAFSDEAKQRILSDTKVSLFIADKQSASFWTGVENACRMFAFTAQQDMQHRPSTEDMNRTHSDARRLFASMLRVTKRPVSYVEQSMLQLLYIYIRQTHPDYEQLRAEKFFGRPPRMRHKRSPPTKPRHWAGHGLIADLGRIYKAGFGRPPSTALESPFSRFVLACLKETEGVPYRVSPDWVQEHVRDHKRAAKQYNCDPWAWSDPPTWDETA